MNNILQDVAYNLGVQAFKNNKPCIPAKDKTFLENCIKGNKVGESVAYLKAWIKGWTDENLKNGGI